MNDRERLAEAEKQLRTVLENRRIGLSFDAWLALQEAYDTVQRCCESVGADRHPTDAEVVEAAVAFETAAKGGRGA